MNFYAVEEGGRVSIVDTGLMGYWDQIPEFLASIGHSMSSVAAIVHTHAHPDHIGCSERLRAESGADAFVHEIEAPALRGDEKAPKPAGLSGVLFSAGALKMVGHMASNGGSKFPHVKNVQTFKDGDVLDVPGKPRIILTPGHSPGHSILLLEQHSVLFSGDALVTRGLKPATGPRLMDINVDRSEARRALDRFEGIEADLLLPGHGEPWRDGVAEAVARAKSS